MSSIRTQTCLKYRDIWRKLKLSQASRDASVKCCSTIIDKPFEISIHWTWAESWLSFYAVHERQYEIERKP